MRYLGAILAALLLFTACKENPIGPDLNKTETLTGVVPNQPAKLIKDDAVYYSITLHTSNPRRTTSILVDSTRDWYKCVDFKAVVEFTKTHPHYAKSINLLSKNSCGLY